ncbi:MAG: hypothetical protein WC372_10515 [Candidatus Neomarinimicrobiota bacterium]|jgi:hypothetical protein
MQKLKQPIRDEMNALPDAVLTLAIPGTKEEAQVLQSILPTLISDALLDFEKCRGRDAAAYVARAYPEMSPEEREEKEEEVRWRLRAAYLLRNAALRLTVECL